MDIPFFESLVILYAGLNLLAFCMFVLDKIRAQKNAWRIPETTLLILAALGPYGALVAMQIFRHKTRHGKFLLVPLFALMHAGLIAWFWMQHPSF